MFYVRMERSLQRICVGCALETSCFLIGLVHEVQLCFGDFFEFGDDEVGQIERHIALYLYLLPALCHLHHTRTARKPNAHKQHV